MVDMKFKAGLVYGIGYALMTTLLAVSIIPVLFEIPWIGLTVGAIAYYTLGYFAISWLAKTAKLLS